MQQNSTLMPHSDECSNMIVGTIMEYIRSHDTDFLLQAPNHGGRNIAK